MCGGKRHTGQVERPGVDNPCLRHEPGGCNKPGFERTPMHIPLATENMYPRPTPRSAGGRSTNLRATTRGRWPRGKSRYFRGLKGAQGEAPSIVPRCVTAGPITGCGRLWAVAHLCGRSSRASSLRALQNDPFACCGMYMVGAGLSNIFLYPLAPDVILIWIGCDLRNKLSGIYPTEGTAFRVMFGEETIAACVDFNESEPPREASEHEG